MKERKFRYDWRLVILDRLVGGTGRTIQWRVQAMDKFVNGSSLAFKIEAAYR